MTEALHDQMSLPQPEPRPPRIPWYRRAAVIIPLVVVVAAVVITTILVVTRGSESAAPAPLRAAVTSALTGAPLAVTLTLPDGTGVPVEPKGSLVTDRVAPGDQISVSADGYISARATVNADRTITATLQPTFATMANQLRQWAANNHGEKITNWVLPPATGFQYNVSYHGSGTRTDPWQMNADVIGQEGFRVQIGVDAAFINGPESLKQMFSKPQQVTLAGQPAWHGPLPEDATQFGAYWQHQPLEVIVWGPDQSTTDAILAAVITVEPAE